jgi:eukaryotic-like serine/threonine-protein kinase
VPERLGRYEVLLPIASGGMATVFLARVVGMAGFEREVALKLTHSQHRDKPTFFTALIDEARLAGRIRHPNVVSVLDVGEAPQGVFIVMDYVEGDSLAGIQRTLRTTGERIPIDVAFKLLDDVLSGLHAAHELRDDRGDLMQIVHRDVTPHNVLLGVDGGTRITDFGIAKAKSRFTKTLTGLVKGKLTYMAPEQARGHKLDRTCDVWAAGVVAWELFSGTRLYEGVGDAALLLKIVREPPTPLRHVRPELPREIGDVVARALTLDAGSRFQTAESFALELAAAARAAGIAIADARRVRSFVQPLVAPALEARRAKVARVLAKRGRVSDGPLAPVDEPTASRQRVLSREADTVAVQPAPASAPAGAMTETVAGREEQVSQTGSLEALLRGSVVPPAALMTAPLRSKVWLLVAIIPAIVLLVVWSVTGSGTTADSTPPAAAASPSTEPLEPEPPASAEPEVDVLPEVITPSELALESANPGRGKPPSRPRQSGRPAVEILESDPPQPPPLDNPYPKR